MCSRVDGHRQLLQLIGAVQQLLARHDAGIIDQQRARARQLLRAPHRDVGGLAVREVALHGEAFGVGGGGGAHVDDGPIERRAVLVEQHHRRSVSAESLRHKLSDAARAARHDRDLACNRLVKEGRRQEGRDRAQRVVRGFRQDEEELDDCQRRGQGREQQHGEEERQSGRGWQHRQSGRGWQHRHQRRQQRRRRCNYALRLASSDALADSLRAAESACPRLVATRLPARLAGFLVCGEAAEAPGQRNNESDDSKGGHARPLARAACFAQGGRCGFNRGRERVVCHA
eukprot:3608697-Prymnesium_polylepis.1